MLTNGPLIALRLRLGLVAVLVLAGCPPSPLSHDTVCRSRPRAPQGPSRRPRRSVAAASRLR
jgi:hypothetical protein